jgi:hypothetical protein
MIRTQQKLFRTAITKYPTTFKSTQQQRSITSFAAAATIVLSGLHIGALIDYYWIRRRQRYQQYSQWKQFQNETMLYVRNVEKMNHCITSFPKQQLSKELIESSRRNRSVTDMILGCFVFVPSVVLSPMVYFTGRYLEKYSALDKESVYFSESKLKRLYNINLFHSYSSIISGFPSLALKYVQMTKWYKHRFGITEELKTFIDLENSIEYSSSKNIQRMLIRMHDKSLFDPETIERLIVPHYMFTRDEYTLKCIQYYLVALYYSFYLFRTLKFYSNQDRINSDKREQLYQHVLYLFEKSLQFDSISPSGFREEINEALLNFKNFFSR